MEEKQGLVRVIKGKLTYANMKKQLRAIHDCGSNDSFSEEDAKLKIEASYSDDKEDTRERNVFYSNSSKKGYNRGNNRGFYKRGSSYNTRRETENKRNERRKNPFERDGNISRCNICNLFIIGPLIAQKKMKQKYLCFQMIFNSVIWLSF